MALTKTVKKDAATARPVAEVEKRVEQFANKLEEKILKNINNDPGYTYRVEIEIKPGKKFYKIVEGHTFRDSRENPSMSVYAFIDKETGDIYKPASWAAPAKHVRGNIFADDFGMSVCGPYGVAYLR